MVGGGALHKNYFKILNKVILKTPSDVTLVMESIGDWDEKRGEKELRDKLLLLQYHTKAQLQLDSNGNEEQELFI